MPARPRDAPSGEAVRRPERVEIVEVVCPDCYGGRLAGIVSRDMATDAGEPSMEGQEILCATCNGDGFVWDTVPAPIKPEGDTEP